MTHPNTSSCRCITWPHDKRLRDPHARWTCSCGASGEVHETSPKTPTKEKR